MGSLDLLTTGIHLHAITMVFAISKNPLYYILNILFRKILCIGKKEGKKVERIMAPQRFIGQSGNAKARKREGLSR